MKNSCRDIWIKSFATYCDAMLESFFFTDEQGHTLFFPKGVPRKGFVVPDAAAKKHLERFLVRYILLSSILPAGALILLLPHWGPLIFTRPLLLISLIVVATLIAGELIDRFWYRKRIRELTAGFAVSDATFTWRQISDSRIHKTSISSLQNFLALSVFLAGCGLLMVIFVPPSLPFGRFYGFSVMLLFVVFAIGFAFQIHRKTKMRR